MIAVDLASEGDIVAGFAFADAAEEPIETVVAAPGEELVALADEAALPVDIGVAAPGEVLAVLAV